MTTTPTIVGRACEGAEFFAGKERTMAAIARRGGIAKGNLHRSIVGHVRRPRDESLWRILAAAAIGEPTEDETRPSLFVAYRHPLPGIRPRLLSLLDDADRPTAVLEFSEPDNADLACAFFEAYKIEDVELYERALIVPAWRSALWQLPATAERVTFEESGLVLVDVVSDAIAADVRELARLVAAESKKTEEGT